MTGSRGGVAQVHQAVLVVTECNQRVFHVLQGAQHGCLVRGAGLIERGALRPYLRSCSAAVKQRQAEPGQQATDHSGIAGQCINARCTAAQ